MDDKKLQVTKDQLELLVRKLDEQKDLNPLEMVKGIPIGSTYLPIDQGNTLGVEAYKAIYEGFDLEGYQWLLMFQRYFTNLWTIANANKQEQTAFKMALATGFWFGTYAMLDDEGELKTYGLTPSKIDENQELIDGDLWINNTTFMGLGTMTQSGIKGGKKAVYGKFNLNGLPMIIMIYNLIKKMVKLDKAFYTNLAWNAKKIVYRQRNNSSLQVAQEMASVANVETSIIIEKATEEGATSPNAFRVLEQPSSNNIDIMSQIREYFGFMFRLIGGYENSVEKAERNVSNEFAKDEIMVKVQLEEIQFELEKFVDRMNEKFKKTFKLESKIEKWMAESKDDQLEEKEDKEDKEVKNDE